MTSMPTPSVYPLFPLAHVDVHGSEPNNHNPIDYKKKTDEIFTNRYLMENIGLAYGVGIDVMLSESAPNKYDNTEYNNGHHKLLRNGKIST